MFSVQIFDSCDRLMHLPVWGSMLIDSKISPMIYSLILHDESKFNH